MASAAGGVHLVCGVNLLVGVVACVARGVVLIVVDGTAPIDAVLVTSGGSSST